MNEYCSGDLYFEDFAVIGVYPEREKPFDFLICGMRTVIQYDCDGLEGFLNQTFRLYSEVVSDDNRSGVVRLKNKWVGQIGPSFEAQCLQPLLISLTPTGLAYG
jgi:hypothetical protein